MCIGIILVFQPISRMKMDPQKSYPKVFILESVGGVGGW